MRIPSTRAGSLAAAAVLAAGLFTALGGGPAAAQISGTVTCFHDPVVGLWIEAKDSAKSGWAWTPNNGQSRQPWKRAELGPNDKYKIRVGCGGTPSKWGTSVKRTFWSGWTTGNRDFNCYDGAVIRYC